MPLFFANDLSEVWNKKFDIYKIIIQVAYGQFHGFGRTGQTLYDGIAHSHIAI